MKKIFLRIVGQVLSISIFMAIFLFSLFITYGYRYDFEEKEVIQTSVIDVCAIPKKADLYLDGEFRSDRACDKIFGLDLGAHTLEIQKDGYFEWTKNIYLDNENVSLYPQIFLIPNPEFYTTTILEENADQVWVAPNQSKYLVYDRSYDLVKIFSVSGGVPLIWEVPYIIEDLIWENNSVVVADTSGGRFQMNVKNGEWELVEDVITTPKIAKNDLIVKGNEVWIVDGDEEEFITRYSEEVQSAQYFYNEYNLLIATEKDIRICDFEGGNCHVVAEKDSWTPVAHPARSKKIIFVKDGALTQIILSGPTGDYYELQGDE